MRTGERKDLFMQFVETKKDLERYRVLAISENATTQKIEVYLSTQVPFSLTPKPDEKVFEGTENEFIQKMSEVFKKD